MKSQIRQYRLQLPVDLKKTVAVSAARHERTMNDEIILRLRQAYDADTGEQEK